MMWQEKEQELEQSPVKDPKIVDLEPELPGKNDRIAVLYTQKLTKQDQMSNRGVLFEFHLKFWNTASIVIPARSLL